MATKDVCFIGPNLEVRRKYLHHPTRRGIAEFLLKTKFISLNAYFCVGYFPELAAFMGTHRYFSPQTVRFLSHLVAISYKGS